jgi:hypothetical protein
MAIPFRNSIPKPKSDYLASLSTPFGIMQHASFDLADPHFGYATDDNARALIIANFWRHEEKKYIFTELEERYIKFLRFLQEPDGRFFCYLTYDLKKQELNLGDWFGRAFFALSFIVANSARFDKPAIAILNKSLPIILEKPEKIIYPRTRAYIILALCYLFKEHKKRGSPFNSREISKLNKLLASWGKDFLAMIKNKQAKNWVWPESIITYDNGKIIQAYFLLGEILENEKCIEAGEKILNFYVEKTTKKGYFQAPGNKNGGFWMHGKRMPLYDEQPLEASSLVSALTTAAIILNKKEYLSKAKLVYEWFFGKNRLSLSLVDKKSGAVHDGLRKSDLNDNKGAESYLSLNLAYFAIKKRVHL